MYEYMGRKLNIGNELLSEYEKLMQESLPDAAVNYYIQLEYGFDSYLNPGKLAEFSDEELTSAVVKNMKDELELISSKKLHTAWENVLKES